jgi:hypothetical protein
MVAMYATFAWIGRLPGVSYSNDDAVYVLLAKSLLHGQYRDFYLVHNPPHIQYPPGWPAMIAAVLVVFGERVDVLLALPLLLISAGLWLTFDLARRWFPPLVALAALLLAAGNGLLVLAGGRLMSDGAFFFFLTLTIWLLAVANPSTVRVFLGGLAAVAAALTRTAGVAVVGAIFLLWLLERRWKPLLVFGGAAALTAGAWLARSFLSPRQMVGRSYLGDLTTVDAAAAGTSSKALAFIIGVGRRLADYESNLHVMIGLPSADGTLVDNVIGLVLLLAACGVGYYLISRKARIVPLVVGCYGAILLFWPWSDWRFIMPLMPLTFVAFIAGTVALASRLGRRTGVLLPAAMVLVCALGQVHWTNAVVTTGLRCDRSVPVEQTNCYEPAPRAYMAATTFARDHLPLDAVVLVDREASFYYHSHRKVYHASEAAAQQGIPFDSLLARLQVTHVLIAQLTSTDQFWLPYRMKPVCRSFEIVQDFNGGTVLFKLDLGEAPPDKADRSCRVLGELLDRAPADLRDPSVKAAMMQH